jgi:hypothetical protein
LGEVGVVNLDLKVMVLLDALEDVEPTPSAVLFAESDESAICCNSRSTN